MQHIRLKTMTATLIDGKLISKKILDDVKTSVDKLDTKPTLAVVQVGDNPASTTYVGIKIKRCKETGIRSLMYKFEDDFTEKELCELVTKLNINHDVNGILVQLPLPKHINEQAVLDLIDPLKDVDGFHPLNMGYLMNGENRLVACTPLGIMKLLEQININLEGKDAVVVGRSNIVGKPVSLLLQQKNATVTMCHSRTKNLGQYTKRADVLVVAVGKPNIITADMIKKGAVVIDVGTNKIKDKQVGDVDFEKAKDIAGYITPVPGGVGPMTVACLMYNTLTAYNLQVKKK